MKYRSVSLAGVLPLGAGVGIVDANGSSVEPEITGSVELDNTAGASAEKKIKKKETEKIERLNRKSVFIHY